MRKYLPWQSLTLYLLRFPDHSANIFAFCVHYEIVTKMIWRSLELNIDPFNKLS